jgi:GH25 family lysozyme M1 (1,4-beta-N-acetylmuramidase)
MTLPRVAALAQALTMILLLLPGPLAIGLAPVRAAVQPVDSPSERVLDASGRGIGCQAGTRKYKGPGLPKDPPWPPGAEPTPSPEQSPAAQASADPTIAPESADPTLAPESSPAEAAVMSFVAATDVGLVQAELESLPSLTSELIPGIDVSHHNGDIDYEAVRDDGHRFVFIKATQDIDFIDPMFPTNLARARAAGLAAGAYHFFDYTLDGTAQADHFLDRVEAAGGIDDALPPVVDVECWKPIGASLHAVSAARLRDFVERVYERTGRMPIVYTSVHMWREVVGNADGFEDLPLWAACWGCDAPPKLAPGWDQWSFWQTGLDRIPSVGKLDGNYFSGTSTDLRALKLQPFAIAGGAPATAGGRVKLDLGGRDATHIRTSTDGDTWSEWSQIGATLTAAIPTEEGQHRLYAQFRNGPGLRSPVVNDSIVVDATPPEVSVPKVSLLEAPLLDAPVGTGGSSLPVTVAWEASDAVAGVADATVAVSCDGDWAVTVAPGASEPGETSSQVVSTGLSPNAVCDVTATSHDAAGNAAQAVVEGLTATVLDTDGVAPAVEVTADQVGVIARRGPDAGRATVLLDGEAQALIDLYAPTAGGPELVFVTDLPPGEHTVAVEPTGSSHPASTGIDVAVDGFATLTR